MTRMVYLVAGLLLALCFGGELQAQASAARAIAVEQPWARATPAGAKTGAVYLTLINNGTATDQLVGATTPLADKVQFHKETEENGVSRMREMPNVDLAPGAKITFKPGEMHMMMVGLKQPLKEGETFVLTLQFAKAGSIAVTVPIEKVGAMQHEDMGAMMHGPGDAMTK